MAAQISISTRYSGFTSAVTIINIDRARIAEKFGADRDIGFDVFGAQKIVRHFHQIGHTHLGVAGSR
ncbi:MAG: hypothetical protein ABI612_22955 [Betaproteobacteria bacterium]